MRMFRLGARALVMLVAAGLSHVQANELRVYHVGNSYTDQINYNALSDTAGSRGHTHTWGRHIIPGAPLWFIWEHPEVTQHTRAPFGGYDNALPNHTWEAVTLQPNYPVELVENGARELVGRFIDLTLTEPTNAGTNFYLYQRWPRRDEIRDDEGELVGYHPLDYASQWERSYTGLWDETTLTREYFDVLHDALVEDYPDRAEQLRVIPSGEALYELAQRIAAGSIPGLDALDELYVDRSHLTPAGQFLIGMTTYATLYDEDPRGLAFEAYGQLDEALAAALQQTAWDVVVAHPHTGVIPEPGSAAALVGMLWVLMRRGGRFGFPG